MSGTALRADPWGRVQSVLGYAVKIAIAGLILFATAAVSPSEIAAQEDPAVPETTTTLAVVAPQGSNATEAPLTDSEKADRTLAYVTIGLVTLALVVAISTALFWRRTKPSRIVSAEAERAASSQPLILRGDARTPEGSVDAPAAAVETVGASVASSAPSSPGGPGSSFSTIPTGTTATGNWASQGWGSSRVAAQQEQPVEPRRQPVDQPVEQRQQPSESEVAPGSRSEREQEPASVLPPGFFGRPDDASNDSDDSGRDAPNPFSSRR